MVEATTSDSLSFSMNNLTSSFGSLDITIPSIFIDKLYSQTALLHQLGNSTFGFSKGYTPLAYIENNFQPQIFEHIKQFCLKYFVENWMHTKLREQKIFISTEPRLTNVSIIPQKHTVYSFSLTLSNPIDFHGWKRFNFKAPKRKNYKDLDRQAENFIKDEESFLLNHKKNIINIEDWVNFSIVLLDNNLNPLFDDHKEILWIKLNSEEYDSYYQSLFVSKKVGDKFVSNHECLQKYFSNSLETNYSFLIEILDYVPYEFFCMEQFKKHFKLKTQREIHLKLVEVFSYRNDVSQRRSTVEDVLKLLTYKNQFEIPSHLILRQQKIILDKFYDNPDYYVYKTKDDFNEKIRQLAEKQVREQILIRQFAFFEDISVAKNDIKYYINLLKRQRTKEFIYFCPPISKINGKESPVSQSLLLNGCLYEKTLNYTINHLSKYGK